MSELILCRCKGVDFGDSSQLAPAACNSNASSNYMGSTVLLDVNSNTPGASPVASALDCCLACIGNAQVALETEVVRKLTLSLVVLEASMGTTRLLHFSISQCSSTRGNELI